MSTTIDHLPYTRTTRLGDVPLFVEGDCTITAAPVVGHPGKYVVRVGDGTVTVHGTLATLERLGREWLEAVVDLTPDPAMDPGMCDVHAALPRPCVACEGPPSFGDPHPDMAWEGRA